MIKRTNLKWTIKVKSVSIVGGAGGVVVVLMCGTTLSRGKREECGGMLTRCNTSRGQPGVNISEDKHLFNLRLTFKLSHSLVRPLN